jgi:hypothetical protein
MKARALQRVLLSVVLATGFFAQSARSASVVEVRVGSHPAFTRIVFELDEPSGYRVERQTLADGSGELVVTIEASSEGRKVRSNSPLLDVVSVEESLGRATARIRLSEGRLALREMILTGPPRIVLDVMAPEKASAVTTTPAPTPAPVAKAPEAEPVPEAMAPKPEVLAEVIPEPEPVVDLQPEPEPGADVPPEPEPVVDLQPEPEPEPERAADVISEPELFAEPLSEDLEAAAEDAGEAERPKAKALVEAPIKPTREMPQPKPPVADRKTTERKTKKAVARAPKKAPPRADEGGGFGLPFGITPLRAGLAGLLLIVAVAAVLLRRRRSIPSDVDPTTVGAEWGDAESFATESTGAPENAALEDFPRYGTEGGVSVSAAPEGTEEGVSVAAAPEETDEEASVVAAPEGTEEGASVFAALEDVEPLAGPEPAESAMQSETQEMSIEKGSAEAPPMPGSDEESELMEIVQEMQRRMAQLESRLDESNAARERLERQVAAQSEELRVQRAAIARTQRALRGLTRTEEEATEPALRGPA